MRKRPKEILCVATPWAVVLLLLAARGGPRQPRPTTARHLPQHTLSTPFWPLRMLSPSYLLSSNNQEHLAAIANIDAVKLPSFLQVLTVTSKSLKHQHSMATLRGADAPQMPTRSQPPRLTQLLPPTNTAHLPSTINFANHSTANPAPVSITDALMLHPFPEALAQMVKSLKPQHIIASSQPRVPSALAAWPRPPRRRRQPPSYTTHLRPLRNMLCQQILPSIVKLANECSTLPEIVANKYALHTMLSPVVTILPGNPTHHPQACESVLVLHYSTENRVMPHLDNNGQCKTYTSYAMRVSTHLISTASPFSTDHSKIGSYSEFPNFFNIFGPLNASTDMHFISSLSARGEYASARASVFIKTSKYTASPNTSILPAIPQHIMSTLCDPPTEIPLDTATSASKNIEIIAKSLENIATTGSERTAGQRHSALVPAIITATTADNHYYGQESCADITEAYQQHSLFLHVLAKIFVNKYSNHCQKLNSYFA